MQAFLQQWMFFAQERSLCKRMLNNITEQAKEAKSSSYFHPANVPFCFNNSRSYHQEYINPVTYEQNNGNGKQQVQFSFQVWAVLAAASWPCPSRRWQTQ